MKTVENNNKKHNNNSSVQMRLVVPIAFIICLLVIATLFLPHLLSPASGYTYDEYGNVVFTPTPGSVFTPLPSVTIDTPLPTTSPSDEDLIILKEGMDSYLVMDMQKALTVLRYLDSDEPSTYFGPALKTAVQLFQRTHHYQQTGEVSVRLLNLMLSEDAMKYYIERGNEGNDVLMLQYRLTSLGFYGEKTNGFYGYATECAVKSFQAMNSLPVTGLADSTTLSVIYSPAAINSQSQMMGIELMPTPVETTPTHTVSPTHSLQPSPTAPKPSSTPHLTPSPTIKPTPKPTPDPTPTPSIGYTPSPTSTPAPTVTAQPTLTPSPTPTQAPSAGVEEFIAVAEQQLGKPYVWSTEGPDSFDCSGLVYYCLRQVGMNVPRYSAAGFSQVESWERINSKNDLKRGDLVFFRNDSGYISHTGIYLGNNKYLHASSSQGKVVISNWGSWANTYFELGRRVFD